MSDVERTPDSSSSFQSVFIIACLVYGMLALVLMHLLRPDYGPVNHMISDYAVGRYGWVMITSFLALSLGCLLLALGLARNGPKTTGSRIGTVLLGVCSIGLVVSAIFPTDLEGAPSTRTGDIHSYSFLVNVICIMLASVLLSVSFGKDSRWCSYKPVAVVLALLVVFGFFLQFFTLHRGMPYGLTNRLFVVLVYTWMLTTSIRLRALVR